MNTPHFNHIKLSYQIGDQKRVVETNSSQLDFSEGSVSLKYDSDGFDNRWQINLSLKHRIELSALECRIPFDYQKVKRLFCNGFQSWTESREYSLNESIQQVRKIAKPFSAHYGDYYALDRLSVSSELYSWNHTYLKQADKRVHFWGSLNEQDGYTLFEFDQENEQLIIKKDLKGLAVEGEMCLMDLVHIFAHESMAYKTYFRLLETPLPKVKPAMGWTSWYYYYSKISEEIILDNLNAFISKKIPIDIFQIDDGYQSAVGDWLTMNKKFSNGLSHIAAKAKQNKMTPGLWLAPFICEKKSEIFKSKQHWLLHNEKGKPRKIGYNPEWSGWYYVLDIYNPEVQSYLEKVFDVVLNEWGFDMVKLDFLFAVASQPHHEKNCGQIMTDAMILLRKWVGDKIILGCGVPLAPAYGRVDYCRIGPDIHLKWEFKLLDFIGAKERPSCFLAVGNTISRRYLDGFAFVNDPDVFLLRSNKNSLSENEKYTLLLTNLLFGNLIFTSDNIKEYSAEYLDLYKSIFPLLKVSNIKVEQADHFYRVYFNIREYRYLAFINNSDVKKQIELSGGVYFDSQDNSLHYDYEKLLIPAHASKLFLSVEHTPFALMGTDGHFFPGAEVSDLTLLNDNITMNFADGYPTPKRVFIKVPPGYKINTINEKEFNRIKKRNFDLLILENKE